MLLSKDAFFFEKYCQNHNLNTTVRMKGCIFNVAKNSIRRHFINECLLKRHITFIVSWTIVFMAKKKHKMAFSDFDSLFLGKKTHVIF